MSRFPDEPRRYTRAFACDSMARTEAVTRTAEKFMGQAGVFDDVPGIFRLMAVEEEMNFGSMGDRQSVCMQFERVDGLESTALRWAEVFSL